MRRFIEALRGSIWASVIARVGAVGCGVVLLAWVGANAGTASASAGGSASAAAVASAAAPAAASAAASAPAATPAPASAAAAAAAAASASASAPAAASAPASASTPALPRRASAEAPVVLNTASLDDLRRLPGVGEKRAEAILALRKRLGRFSRIEDLLRVKGIGRATLRKWRPVVRVDPPDAPRGEPAAQASAERRPATSGPMASERSL